MSENVSIRCGLIGCMGKMGQEIRGYLQLLEIDSY